MPITAPQPQSNYKLSPEGTFPARVFKIINLGTHEQEFQGKVKKNALIRIYWELPTELDKFTVKDEDGSDKEIERPFAVSREFTLSMAPKANLRPIVEGIIATSLSDDEAQNYDMEDLLGRACLVTVVHKENRDRSRKYAFVNSTAGLMKGQEAPAAVNEPIIQDVNVMTREEISNLPDWLEEMMQISDEFKRRFEDGDTEEVDEIKPEDIPF